MCRGAVDHELSLWRALRQILSTGGWCIKAIGGLCLEIYLIQWLLLPFADRLNFLFPLSIPLMFLAIVVSAYLLRCLARVFSQTFREAPYDWKAVFRVV